ncbi:MAG: Nif3-like dinuclear metal center hexameric protein [Acidobacteria bacterium]|nr:Nif3-like dinuclear metal center hexameric protein [Acidobacteriota bacterium]
MADLKKIVEFLNGEMRIEEYPDSSHNGLQVENGGRVEKICCGVDASLEFFAVAQKRGADLLICHHGISWGDSLKQITGLNYRRLAFLIKHDIALYACHIPLDAHSQLGNNALLFKALGLGGRKLFADYRGKPIGYYGHLPRSRKLSLFRKRVEKILGTSAHSLEFGRDTIRTVGIVSGGGSDWIEEADRLKIDLFLTGEASLVGYNTAKDCGINVIFGGHYATESFGVRALGAAVEKKYRLKSEFIDLKLPF